MIRIVPAIDIMDGKCVRLFQGDYSQKTVYNEDPLEVAKNFEAHGIAYLHLVDLDGAKEQRVVNHRVLEKIAAQTSLKIDFGGGIRTDEDVRVAFESGVSQIVVGSLAVKEEARVKEWMQRLGPEKLIVGADVKGEKIAIHGWMETAELTIYELIENYWANGLQYVLCTDVSKDGAMEGPANELYEKILSEYSDIKLIASGGVSDIDDVYQLHAIGAESVIIGKAIYEGKIDLKELSQLC